MYASLQFIFTKYIHMIFVNIAGESKHASIFRADKDFAEFRNLVSVERYDILQFNPEMMTMDYTRVYDVHVMCLVAYG